jgi:DNA polymerase-3 subunit delta'
LSWDRVRGHDALVRAFGHAVQRGRLAHAYLFTGPPGVGKRLFAHELAKALLCEGPTRPRLEACDRCPSCLHFEAGTHPDYFSGGRPADSLELPIEVIRELCRNFALKPARGRGKVIVLDDADDLNEESANCFLKTLEEPPPGALLLLIGTRRERQLATIVSRCQVIRFAPLPDPVMMEILRAEGIEDPAPITRLTRLSDGSPGQALALAEPALWEFRRTLLDGLTQEQPDTVALAEAWTRFVEEAGKEAAAQRRRAALVLRLLVGFLRDALRFRAGALRQQAEPEDLHSLEELARRADPEKLLKVLDRCMEGDMQIDRRVQLVLVLEALMDALGQQLQTAK